MTVFFSIGLIEFDFAALMSFLIGVSFGMGLFVLIYLYALLRNLNKQKPYLFNTKETDVDKQEIEALVQRATQNFKNKELKKDASHFKYAYDLSVNLAQDIAQKFYPNSKYPLLELSIDETLMLAHYISDRIEQVFEGRLLRVLRKRTLSQLMSMRDVKVAIDENPIVKTSKKLKVKQIFSTAMAAINIINPIYWTRKIIINRAIDAVIKKICIVAIGITGEETYKIYSKRVFNEELTINAGIDDLYKELQDEMRLAVHELEQEESSVPSETPKKKR